MSNLRRAQSPTARLAKVKRRPGLSEEQLEELREAFDLFDTDHSGAIDARELKAAMRALGFEVNKDQVRQMVLDIGKDATSSFSFEDFCELMSTKLADKFSRGEILKVFQLFDDEDTGKITFRNLKRVALELGEALTDEELHEMLEEADRNGDGVISPDEFYRVMRRRGDDPLDDFASDDE
eukprot:GDKJ01020465.1.p1 GENE.GDKJ01020465.1~~GDKJ01020465.1.p1  ORF type:complete len:181 (-),score=43.20 GDKJ01020465.1:39-581(-)